MSIGDYFKTYHIKKFYKTTKKFLFIQKNFSLFKKIFIIHKNTKNHTNNEKNKSIW